MSSSEKPKWWPISCTSTWAAAIQPDHVRHPHGATNSLDAPILALDAPSGDEVVYRMKAKRKFQILGLFRGVGLPFRFESAPIRLPNMIWLYRRPILAYWSGHQDTLEAIITHVLVHEIGHHFGLSDDDMHGIEARAD